MNQTKLESGIEIAFNYVSGFLLAWAVYAFIVLPVPWLKDSAFFVTCLFTFVSVIRSFFWRRVFNAGLHKGVHRVVSNIFKLRRKSA